MLHIKGIHNIVANPISLLNYSPVDITQIHCTQQAHKITKTNELGVCKSHLMVNETAKGQSEDLIQKRLAKHAL
jgi:hypothetical protein